MKAVERDGEKRAPPFARRFARREPQHYARGVEGRDAHEARRPGRLARQADGDRDQRVVEQRVAKYGVPRRAGEGHGPGRTGERESDVRELRLVGDEGLVYLKYEERARAEGDPGEEDAVKRGMDFTFQRG